MEEFIIGSAFILDLVVGDPQGWPHPVRVIGWMIDKLSGWCLNAYRTSLSRRIAGVGIVVAVTGATWLVVSAVIAGLSALNELIGAVAAVILCYTAIAAKSLYKETWRVIEALEEDDLPRARKLLSMVVGRDTANLDKKGVLKAVTETVAENLSDGVISPLFFIALGGPALGMSFKAVSTMDSMIGYKNEKFKDIGWAAAKLDDVLNYIPARLTALLIVAAAWIIRLDYKEALWCWLNHGDRHSSPNAGRPEAAMAGALNVQLGGPGVYHGVLVEKPILGRIDSPLSERKVYNAEQILFIGSGIAVIAIIVVRSLF